MHTHGLIKMVQADGSVVVETFAARQKRITKAVGAYARKHGYSVSTVRVVSTLRRAALQAAGI
jgi:hypothetical protein